KRRHPPDRPADRLGDAAKRKSLAREVGPVAADRAIAVAVRARRVAEGKYLLAVFDVRGVRRGGLSSAGAALGDKNEDDKSGSKECAHMQVPQLSSHCSVPL